MEDGATLQTCKSFKYNISEIMNKYHTTNITCFPANREFIANHNTFMKRAYKELLEECSKLMQSKVIYKTMYTLDGQPIETMDDLKSLCDQPITQRRMIEIKLSKAVTPTPGRSVSKMQEHDKSLSGL